MELTEAQKKVLLHMAQYKDTMLLGPGGIGAGALAKPDSVQRKPQAYARVAGKVLNALQKKGLVGYVTDRDLIYDLPGDWGWQLSVAGRALVKELEE